MFLLSVLQGPPVQQFSMTELINGVEMPAEVCECVCSSVLHQGPSLGRDRGVSGTPMHETFRECPTFCVCPSNSL